jgi:2-dehydropantoate 2-reductase
MKDIQSALVVGAGAVGCAIADVIAERRPAAVRVLASTDRLKRYRSEGFVINGRRREFTLVTPEQAAPADLVIVAVKNHHLPCAIKDMSRHVGPSTLILSLLNGISSEDALASAFGREKVPYAVVIGIDAVREGNATRFSSAGKIHFGDAVNAEGAWSERISRIADFFSRTGVAYVVPPDMLKTLWYKYMINVIIAGMERVA